LRVRVIDPRVTSRTANNTCRYVRFPVLGSSTSSVRVFSVGAVARVEGGIVGVFTGESLVGSCSEISVESSAVLSVASSDSSTVGGGGVQKMPEVMIRLLIPLKDNS
jgi:hypothetical protein